MSDNEAPRRISMSSTKDKKYISKTHKRIENLEQLNGYILVYHYNLRYLFGCWIKCIDKRTGEYLSGGFLIRVDTIEGNVYLKNPRIQEELLTPIGNYDFYVSSSSENYKALQQIELEKSFIKKENEKIAKKQQEIDRQMVKIKEFQSKERKFLKMKEKFIKLFNNGYIKILI